MDDLKAWLRQCEGYNNKLYEDTVGKVTIGYGRNIQDRGISRDEAELMLDNDIKLCIEQLSKYDWYKFNPENVQKALVNMCFMGIGKLLGFTKMIKALEVKDYTTAAKEALNSKWASQVGKRAKDVAIMIRQGSLQNEKGTNSTN